jgi:hypothetical protein
MKFVHFKTGYRSHVVSSRQKHKKKYFDRVLQMKNRVAFLAGLVFTAMYCGSVAASWVFKPDLTIPVIVLPAETTARVVSTSENKATVIANTVDRKAVTGSADAKRSN